MQISSTILVLADHAEVVPLVRADDYESVISLRHPDPHDVAHREVHHEGLQVRGSWRKIPLRKSVKIKPRFAFASFVWEENSERVLSAKSFVLILLKAGSMSWADRVVTRALIIETLCILTLAICRAAGTLSRTILIPSPR